MGYLIITPVHNEQEHLVRFLDSIVSQTNLPDLCLLVNDNSTDDTDKILKIYSEKYNWIKSVYRKSSTIKVQGSKVIETFNYGLSRVDINSYDYISKIDADLEFDSTFFDCVINSFKTQPSVGLIGGFIQEFDGKQWVTKHDSDYHVRGALKTYRTKAFKEIGGLKPVFGWDGLDEMQLFYHGWQTHNITNKVKHYRQAGSDYSSISLSYRSGKANYINGCNFIMAIVRSVVRMKVKPYFLAGIAFFMGYLVSFAKREEKIVEKDLAKYINNFHKKRILKIFKSN